MTGREIHVGSRLAGYRLDAIAGRGGMGVVYRATEIDTGLLVALKVIAPELAEDGGAVERFKREARHASAVEHPNVISVLGAGDDAGILYLVTEYVEGTDLGSVIARHGRLAPDFAAEVVSALAAGLDAAHAAGLVHRDVKPANALIARDGRIYLSDFGLTRELAGESAVTTTGSWVGTLDYVSPEQVKGQPVDARSDVYSLGALAYHVLAGRVLFSRRDDMAKMWAHVHEPPPSLTLENTALASRLSRVLRIALSKDPADRYPSAGDLARAVAAAIANEPEPSSTGNIATGNAAPSQQATTALDDLATQQLSTASPPDRPTGHRRLIAALGALVSLMGAVTALFVGGVFGDRAPSATTAAPGTTATTAPPSGATVRTQKRRSPRQRAAPATVNPRPTVCRSPLRERLGVTRIVAHRIACADAVAQISLHAEECVGGSCTTNAGFECSGDALASGAQVTCTRERQRIVFDTESAPIAAAFKPCGDINEATPDIIGVVDVEAKNTDCGQALQLGQLWYDCGPECDDYDGFDCGVDGSQEPLIVECTRADAIVRYTLDSY